MGIYYKDENYTLYEGKMEEVLKALEAESIDSIVTDPPYDLTSITKRFGSENASPCKEEGTDGSFARLSKGFMGKTWDGTGIAFKKETWEECWRVLKPGGYLLAFGGTRTYHRMAVAIEDAGFEIRDCIMWLYGSGFPKSMNVGLAIDKKNGVDNRTGNIVKGVGSNNTNSMKNGLGESQEFASEYEERVAQNEWSGWGTCLKPAYEPIIVARKPLCGSVADNIMTYGVGAINIDECRVEFKGDKWVQQKSGTTSIAYQSEETTTANGLCVPNDLGRFPANIITDGSEEVASGLGDEGSAMRYFYCAKASKKDRDEGLEDFETKSHEEINNRKEGSAGATRQYGGGTNPFLSVSCPRKNTHPTVKPTELMQYLVRLVTPEGGVVLDPFNGSGSTGKACMFENRERDSKYYYIGIEMTEEYLPIAKARIDYAIHKFEYDAIKAEEEMKATGQMNLFDFEEE